MPRANPGYDNKMHLVKEWLIEFDQDDSPWREIGIAANGSPVFAGPSDENYGFWLDTNMHYSDFQGEPVDKAHFEKLWSLSGVVLPKAFREGDGKP